MAQKKTKAQPVQTGPLHEAAAQGSSPLHRLDPRAKLVTALGFTVAAATAQSFLTAWTGLVLGIFCVLLAQLGPGLVLKRLIAVNVFVVFLWFFLPWKLTASMDPWDLGLIYNPAGLTLAGLISLKVNAVFLVILGLLGTSRVNDIFHALDHMRLPPKLVTLFLLFHRYLFVIYHEYGRLVRAMKARCFHPGTNLHTYRSYAHLLGMLLARSFDRAERVYQAMLCRGFNGTFWVLDHFHWQRRDTAFCIWSGLAVAAMLVLEWGRLFWN